MDENTYMELDWVDQVSLELLHNEDHVDFMVPKDPDNFQLEPVKK